MKLPSRDYVLAGGLVCPSADIDRAVWQGHLVKHPLGVHGKMRGGMPAPWNEEGWDRTEPPVVPAEMRPKLVAAIGAIWRSSAGCGVPDFVGQAKGPVDVQPICRACPGAVLAECDRLCNTEYPVGQRYAEATESLLADLVEGIGEVVTRDALRSALMRKLRTPAVWDGLTVLTVGLAASGKRTLVAQIVRGDGLLAEFFLNDRTLGWRTTYRRAGVTQLNVKQSHLLDMAIPVRSLGALSELCVVPRLWWGGHGH